MLTIRLLGAIEVAVDGEPIPLTPRAVGVLVRLALAAAPVPRDRLLMDLWGDDVDPARRRSLETLVWSIRNMATGKDGLLFTGDSYQLTSPVWVDIEHVISAADDLTCGTATQRSLARAVLADRGEPTIHRLGISAWLDELEQRLTEAQAGIRSAAAPIHVPEVRYVVDDDRHLAFQVREGHGMAVLLIAGLATHIEGIWDAPGFPEWVDAAIGTHPLVMFDKRGTGLSDPVADVPTDDDFVADAVAALDASGVEKTVLVCASEAGMFGARLAAERPDLIAGVVFINAIAKMFEAPDFPCGLPERIARDFGASVRKTWARDDVGLEISAPSRVNDRDFAEWAARYQRLAASPGAITQLANYTAIGDGREAARAITQPSLVIQSRHSSYFRPTNATWLCESLGLDGPIWLDSADHLFWVAEPAIVTAAVEAFLDSVDTPH
jgi:pimeloyl-ACP methyl ester carboxylesterase